MGKATNATDALYESLALLASLRIQTRPGWREVAQHERAAIAAKRSTYPAIHAAAKARIARPA